MSDPDATRSLPPKAAASDSPAGGNSEAQAARLVTILDQYLANLEAGSPPEREKLLAAHPDLAPQLERCLSGMEFIHRAARPAADAPVQLGDFRIIREVGRGGMGVVYEARQLSLNRRVALKVLRFGGVADKEAMARFRREAETVAQLHHTNIVPIFAIGSQEGVSFYAMEFIEGRSLAAVVDESHKSDTPLAPVELARWGLQAAEALAHAHQRGVIHRDVKPSNLILDPDGQIWLTDFGLAKRLNDLTLSITGALLGTPRYMSPEQASAAKLPVDQRTDIYSLGASLYELATGKPVFDADSALGIITQILSAEPPPPRSLRPALQRDLETIIVKCLSKEPRHRYATAQDLADDLRAFAEGRAIKARRAALAERAVRWAKKQKRSMVLAGVSAVAAAVLIAAGIVGSSLYRQSQLGYVSLKTGVPSLVAEVLEEGRDEQVLPPFTVPNTEPVALPAAAYRLRLSQPGHAAETVPLLVERGRRLEFGVGLSHQFLWEPLELGSSDTARVVELSGRPYVIRTKCGSERALSLLYGATAKPVWELKMEVQQLQRRTLEYEGSQDPPELVQPAPDLDGDGMGDLVWACRRFAALWAISGKGTNGKGKELWWFSDGAGETLGVPAVADVDGDGTPDLIATFANGYYEAWIEAVSGKTGKSLWRCTLEKEWLQDTSEHGHASRWAAEVVRLDGREIVVCTAGTHLVGLELQTGKPVWPACDLGMEPAIPPRIADLDNDGQPDLLLLAMQPSHTLSLLALSLKTRTPLWQKVLRENAPRDDWSAEGAYNRLRDWPWVADLDGNHRLKVIVPVIPAAPANYWEQFGHRSGVEVLDGATGQSLWIRRLKTQDQLLGCDHLIVGPDLDGDGSRELFVAAIVRNQSTQSVFVDALSGKDGHSLWWWESVRSYACISGGGSDHSSSGGFTSYINQHHLPCMGRLRWGPAGPDGWPQLVVPYDVNDEKTTAMLSAETGRLTHELTGLYNLLQVADLDGDGIPDLAFRDPGSDRLCAIRGTAPETWRRLGDWRPAQDFDGDGIPDLLGLVSYSHHGSGMDAVSGKDGHILWRGEDPFRNVTRLPLPPPNGDLDGDGTPDILDWGQEHGQSRDDASGNHHLPMELRAVSGRTGRRLWSAEDLLITPDQGDDNHDLSRKVRHVTCQDLNGDGRPMAVVSYDVTCGQRLEWCLAVLSGQDGKAVWRQAIMRAPRYSWEFPRQPVIADLKGDKTLDLVVVVPVPLDKDSYFGKQGMWGCELRAFSGRDGKLLWRSPLPVQRQPHEFGGTVTLPVVGDLNGDGKREVMVLARGWHQQDGKENLETEVLALSGLTGEPLWTWRYPKPDDHTNYWGGIVRLLLANPDGDGHRLVCASKDWGPDAILDGHGQVLPSPERRILEMCDLDGDGKDECLFYDNTKLWATRGATGKVLWERSHVWGLREILPAKPGQPVTVVALVQDDLLGHTGLGEIGHAPRSHGSTGDYLLGLDGATGQPRWRFPSADADEIVSIGGEGSTGIPWLVGRSDGATVCRQAVSTGPSGACLLAGQLQVYGPPPEDPRFVRNLPWASEVPPHGSSSRRYDPPSSLGMLQPVVQLHNLGSLVFVALVIASITRRRWRRLRALLAAFVVVTFMAALIFLWSDARHMDPAEHYSWRGWYGIWTYGLFFTGGLILLWLCLRAAWWLLRRLFGRPKHA